VSDRLSLAGYVCTGFVSCVLGLWPRVLSVWTSCKTSGLQHSTWESYCSHLPAYYRTATQVSYTRPGCPSLVPSSAPFQKSEKGHGHICKNFVCMYWASILCNVEFCGLLLLLMIME